MPIDLSRPTRGRLELLFSDPERQTAVDLLVQECGDNLPLCEDTSPKKSERIRFAVLKMSEGDLGKLREAVDLAKLDWRDLLVSAGFANDIRAHLQWWPSEISES